MYYRRRLPHFQFNQGTYFITFSLAGSLPKRAVKAIQMQVDNLKSYINIFHRQQFKKYENLLDGGDGPFWLKDERVANIVADKIHSLDGIRYDLVCFTIMPNHVHMLFKVKKSRAEARSTGFDPALKYPVTDIMKLLKGGTAREANKILGRSGSFWHHESYDSLVRDVEERDRTIKYILNNPVKAKLTNNWIDWPWSYIKDGSLPIR